MWLFEQEQLHGVIGILPHKLPLRRFDFARKQGHFKRLTLKVKDNNDLIIVQLRSSLVVQTYAKNDVSKFWSKCRQLRQLK